MANDRNNKTFRLVFSGIMLALAAEICRILDRAALDLDNRISETDYRLEFLDSKTGNSVAAVISVHLKERTSPGTLIAELRQAEGVVYLSGL